MYGRWAAVVAVLGFVLSASQASAAYREAHATGYDMHARVDETGVAQMEHAVTYHVTAGSLSSVDLVGVEPSVSVDSEVVITAEDGRTIAGHATLQPGYKSAAASGGPPPDPKSGAKDASIHIDVLEKKGLRRGIYIFKLRYRLDLVAEKAISKDLALWRIAWTSPALPEGIDGERVVFDLPAAPTEPRAVRSDAGSETAGADGIVSTLRRSADRDELEIVRLHVPQGERVTWGARVDPKAFPAVRAPELRPPPLPAPPAPDRLRDGMHLALVGVFGVAFALLVAKKTARVSVLFARERMMTEVRRSRRPTCNPERPLLPVPRAPRVALAGGSMAACVALQMGGSATWGALFLVCAMAAAAHRAPRVVSPPRGPGSWSMLREREAFAPPRPSSPMDVLDASTHAGKVLFGLLAAAAAAGGYLTSRGVPVFGRTTVDLCLLDLLVLVPIFFTGTRAQLPPSSPHASSPWLKSLFVAMKKRALSLPSANAFRIVPWARHPVGSEAHDELRLLVLPRASMPGVIGIEIGGTWPGTESGSYLSPELLVRVHDASAAAAKLLALAPKERPVPGRRTHERVVRFKPEIPTLAATRDLALSLVHALVDRRAHAAAVACAWEGLERRLPPAERTRAAHEAHETRVSAA
ncbi:MAG TPA: hypothetical protein VNO21_11325 [Polyangiaceae bacterium]|nr:hypothetical protein [Polyangiaceae bacterium]